MGVLRGNGSQNDSTTQNAASLFARMALSKVGGSSVFIEPRKTGGKLLDTDDIK